MKSTLSGKQMALPMPAQTKPYRPFQQWLIDCGAKSNGNSRLDPSTENRYFIQFRAEVMSLLVNGLLEPSAAVVADLGKDAYRAAACAKNIDVLEGRIESFSDYWQAVKVYIEAAGVSEQQCRVDFEKLLAKSFK